MKLTREKLMTQLMDSLTGDFEIERIDEMSNRKTLSGSVFHKRDRLAFVYDRRLRVLREKDPESSAVPVCKTVFSALSLVGDSETLFSWTVRKQGRRIDGFSTEKRLIIVFPESFINENADEPTCPPS